MASFQRSGILSAKKVSFRIAMAPPQAKGLGPDPKMPATAAFQTERTRDQNPGGSGVNQRYPVAAPACSDSSGATSARSQRPPGFPSLSANTSTSERLRTAFTAASRFWTFSLVDSSSG